MEKLERNLIDNILERTVGLEYHRFTRESYRKMMSEAGE